MAFGIMVLVLEDAVETAGSRHACHKHGDTQGRYGPCDMFQEQTWKEKPEIGNYCSET